MGEKALLSQPEKALTAKMKTSQIAFTLVLLVLNESKADKVTSCIQCESFPTQENSECIAGTGKGTTCQTEAVGCFAMRLDGKVEGQQEAITWTRGCCIENIQCTEIHEDSEVNGISGMVDQMGCTTNDCNTMDPRSSARSLVPAAITIVLLTLSLMV